MCHTILALDTTSIAAQHRVLCQAMYSTFQRLQTFLGQLSTFGSILCVLIASTALFYPNTATSEVDVRLLNVVYGRAAYAGQDRVQDYATMRFDLDADFRDLFNWNTKQVFVYLSASYPGSKFVDNEIVLWDQIIRDKDKAKLKLRNQDSKYKVNDVTGQFK